MYIRRGLADQHEQVVGRAEQIGVDYPLAQPTALLPLPTLSDDPFNNAFS